jgi:hypothetical protein
MQQQHAHACVYLCRHVCMCVLARVLSLVLSMSVCQYVFSRVRYVCSSTCVGMRAQVRAYACVYVCAFVCVCACACRVVSVGMHSVYAFASRISLSSLSVALAYSILLVRMCTTRHIPQITHTHIPHGLDASKGWTRDSSCTCLCMYTYKKDGVAYLTGHISNLSLLGAWISRSYIQYNTSRVHVCAYISCCMAPSGCECTVCLYVHLFASTCTYVYLFLCVSARFKIVCMCMQ